MPTPAREAGFSLIETLVALAIGALVSATMVSTMSGALGRTSNAERIVQAKRLAQTKLDAWSLIGDRRDEEGSAGVYRWRIEARPYLLDPLDPSALNRSRLSEIIVKVEWDDGTQVRNLSLRTFRAESGE